MEKHQSELVITKNFLKANENIMYVLPSTLRTNKIIHAKFSQFGNIKGVLKYGIIDDISSKDEIKFCCDHERQFSGGYGLLRSSLDSVIYSVKEYKQRTYYIEDIAKFNLKCGSICLDCCEIECFVKDEFENQLKNENNAIFLWPKRS